MAKAPPGLSRYFSEIGKKGGKARLTKLTEEQRREIASAAGKRSGEARRKKARTKAG
jgi:general stress protein YciG